MALIGEMKYLTIGDSTYSVPSSGGGGGGTVTSVQVQATSPVQSSNSSAQSAVLNTTISLANGYGDTKNPYASKSKNQVLATPTNASGAPSFRALDASDIPDLSGSYLPASTSIPTKTSDLTNDSGFITGYTETDPTVPSWAKQSSKPTYTASEVGALPSTTVIPSAGTGTSYPAMDGTKSLGSQAGFARVDHVHPTDTSRVPTSRTVNGKALSSNITLSASDVGALPSTTSIPSKTSDLTNDSDFVEDASYVHTDNNFTTTLKSKLNGIAEGAEVNVQANWTQTTTTADDYIKNKPTIPTTTSQLTNNSGFITSAALPTKVSDLDNDSGFITSYTETDPTVPAWAKASTKPAYTASEVGAVSLTNGYATDSELLDATTISAWQTILGIS